jgi:hypothetical protein
MLVVHQAFPPAFQEGWYSMNLRTLALAIPVVAGLACADQATAPQADRPLTANRAQTVNGTGLVLNSVTGLSLPLIGSLGTITINQAEITNFALVENTLGQIVGLQANGVLQLTGGVLGSNVVTQNFNTTVSVTSSGSGQCSIVTIDLAPININALVAQVDIPAATVDAQGSGALGSLLCNLGQLLNPVTQGVRSVVQAINRLI